MVGRAVPTNLLNRKKPVSRCSRSKKSTISYGSGSHLSATAYSGLQIDVTVMENVIKFRCK
jgi:hypothetical protein